MRTISSLLAGGIALALGSIGGGALGADQRSAGPFADGVAKPYVGVGIGRSRFDDAPCVAPFACEKRDTAYKLFTGATINRYLGAEVTYLDFGDVDRNGGETEAYGFNLGLVGTLPVGAQFSLLGKVGTIYSRTRTRTATPLVASGRDDGFGLSYGIGARYDLTRNWAVRADWDRYRAQFRSGDDYISVVSAGLAYTF